MAEHSKIEWTDATWNPVTGCSVVSPGCTNCYAMRLAGGRFRHMASRAGLTAPSKAGPVWTGEVRFNEQWLDKPLRWRKPKRIFVCAHGDLFHESVPDAWIDQIFAVMALAPRHTFQVLTKRAERMREYCGNLHAAGVTQGRVERAAETIFKARGWDHEVCSTRIFERMSDGLPNIWLGVSVEDQTRADLRVPLLLDTPAAVHFVSAEPLLGLVDLDQWLHDSDCLFQDPHMPRDPELCTCSQPREVRLDWVIAGGESGRDARPMHPAWPRSLRDQCAEAGVPFNFKQWGGWAPDTGAPADGPDRVMEGRDPCAWHDGSRWHFAADGYAVDLEASAGYGEWVYRSGKIRTGRMLDGVVHDGYPA